MRIDLWCNARDIVIYSNKQRNKNAKNNIKLKSGTLSPMFITIESISYCQFFDPGVNLQRPLYPKKLPLIYGP